MVPLPGAPAAGEPSVPGQRRALAAIAGGAASAPEIDLMQICERSAQTRTGYLARLEQAISTGPVRKGLSCTNLAHAFAAFPTDDKRVLRGLRQPKRWSAPSASSAWKPSSSNTAPAARLRSLRR